MSAPSKPTERAITIAVASTINPHRDGWVEADVVRGKLRLLGFDCTTQQVAAWLAKMARTEAPWVDRRRCPWDHCWQYRATYFGANDVENNLLGIKLRLAYPLRPLAEREAAA